MVYQSPGLGDERVDWILGEVRKAQETLDSKIAEASQLPDTEPSKVIRIQRLNQMKREVDTAFFDLDRNIVDWASKDVPSFYRQGYDIAAAYLGAGFSFTLPHRQALAIISEDAYADVATRLQQVRAGFSDKVELQKMYEGLDPAVIAKLQASSRSAVTQMLLTGEDPRRISKRLAQDLWRDGVQIIDAGGNRWNPEKYTRMLIRTKSANAYNAGSLNKYASAGVKRVRVFDGMEDDPECADANGQIWTLDYAMEHVIEHPNCRRAFAVEQGKGSVDRKNPSPLKVLFDQSQAVAAPQYERLQTFLKAMTASQIALDLREFRRTGEIQLSEFMVQWISAALTEWLGKEIPYIDRFVTGFVAETTRSLDAVIESYVDPVLVSLNLIEQMPTRAQVVAMRQRSGTDANFLRSFVDDLVFRIERAKLIPDSPMNKTVEVLQTISREADDLLTRLQPALDRGALGLVEVLAQELVQAFPEGAARLVERKYVGLIHDILLASMLEDVTGVRSTINQLLPQIRPTLESFRSFKQTGILRLPPGLVNVMAQEADQLVGKRFPEVGEVIRQVFLDQGTVRRFLTTGAVPQGLATLIAREAGQFIPSRFPEVESFIRNTLINPAVIKGIRQGRIPRDLIDLAAREAFDLMGDQIPSIGKIVREVLNSPQTIEEFKVAGRLPYTLVELLMDGIAKVDRLKEFSGVFREILNQPTILVKVREGVIPQSIITLVSKQIQEVLGEKIPNIGRIVSVVMKSPQYVDDVRLGGRLPFEVVELLVDEMKRVVPDEAAEFARRVLELTDTAEGVPVSPLDAIRNFYETGELPFTSTLAELVESGVSKQLDEFLNPTTELYIRATVRESANLLARWIESYIDPVLVSAGLIKAMPPQAEVLAMTGDVNKVRRYLRKLARQLDGVIDESEEAIPAIQGFRVLRERVELLAEQAEEMLAPALLAFALGAEVKERGLIGLIEAIGEFIDDAPYGQTVGELMNIAARGEFDDLQRSWKAAEAYISSMNALREEFHLAMYEQYQDVVQDLRDITEARRAIGQILAEKAADARRAGLFDQVNEINWWDVPESVQRYLPSSAKGKTFFRTQLQRLDAELFRLEIDTYGKALELRYAGTGVNPRLFPFPAAFESQYKAALSHLWEEDVLDEAVDLLSRTLTDSSVPVFDIRLFETGANALKRALRLDSERVTAIVWESIADNRTAEEFAEWLNRRRPTRAFLQRLVDFGAAEAIEDLSGDLILTRVDESKLVELVADQLSRLHVAPPDPLRRTGVTVLFDGATIPPTEVAIQNEILLYLTPNMWKRADDLMAEFPTAFVDLKPRLDNMVKGSTLQELWNEGYRKPSMYTLRSTVEVDSATLQGYMAAILPGRVVPVAGGANGTNLIVTLASGEKVFVKTFNGNGGVQGDPMLGVISQILTSHLADDLGTSLTMSTRVIEIPSTGELALIHPAFENADKLSDALSSGYVMDIHTARRQAFVDLLTRESDPNSGNYMVDRLTGSLVSIDSEAGFFYSLHSSHLGEPHRAWEKVVERILLGEESPDLPRITLIPVSEAEREVLSAGSSVIDNLVPGEWISSLDIPLGRAADGEIYALGGVMGQFRPSSLDPNQVRWTPSMFLTETELDWVTLPYEVKIERYVEVITEQLESLSEEATLAFRFNYGGREQSLDVAVRAVAEKAALLQERDLGRMISDARLDISGGVDSYISPTGLVARVGEKISWISEDGEVVYGTVLRVFEDVGGDMQAHVAVGVGWDLTEREMNQLPELLAKVNLNRSVPGDFTAEPSWVRRLEEYVEADELEDLILPRRSTIVYEEQPGGLFKPVRTESVAVDIHIGVFEDYVYRRNGFVISGTLPDDVVRDVKAAVNNALDELLPSERPLRVVVSSRGFQMDDGRVVLGYFDADTRTAYVSTQSLLRKLPTDELGRIIVEDPKRLVWDLDFESFTETLRHELIHSRHVGRELEFRVDAAKRIVQQMVNRNPDLLSEDDWSKYAVRLLRDMGYDDLAEVDDPLAALVRLKVSIVEDVNNSNLAQAARKLAELGLPPSIPDQVRFALLRGEPDAHWELMAEVLADHGSFRGWVDRVVEPQLVNSFGSSAAEEILVDYYKWAGVLDSQNTISYLPIGDSWVDLNLGPWIEDQLFPGARLLPVNRDATRRFWAERELPIQELAERLSAGGFTFEPITGEFETAGLAVAIKKNEQEVRGWSTMTPEEKAEILQNFYRKNQALLDQDDWKIGGWMKEDGTAVLDTSRLFQDRTSAARFGFQEDQDAIFDLGLALRTEDFDAATIPLKTKYKSFEDWQEGEGVTTLREQVLDVLTPKADAKGRTTLEAIDGTPPTLTMKALPELKPEGQGKGSNFREWILERLYSKDVVRSDGEIVDWSPERIKQNLIEVLEVAERRYGDPETGLSLRQKHFFYVTWNEMVRAKSVEYNVPVTRFAAAAAVISSALDAEVNLKVAEYMIDTLMRDLPVGGALNRVDDVVDDLRRFLRMQADAYKGYADESAEKVAKTLQQMQGVTDEKALRALQTTLRRQEKAVVDKLDFERRLRETAEQLYEGFRFSEIEDDRIVHQILHRLRQIETGSYTPGDVSKLPAGEGNGLPGKSSEFYVKAIMAIRGHDDLYHILGDTKYRPFYNNIMDPYDLVGIHDVTIDYHMVDMALRIISGQQQKVKLENPRLDGLSWGIRVIIADMVRELWDEGWGLRVDATSPAQLQEVLWATWKDGRDLEWWGKILPAVEVAKK